MARNGPGHMDAKRIKLRTYLQILAKVGTVSKAAKAAGIIPKTVERARQDRELGEWFTQAEMEAFQVFNDYLVDNAVERAVDGWHEPVIHKGELSYMRHPSTGELMLDEDFEPIPLTVKKKSDTLLIKLLEAKVPEFRKSGGSTLGVGIGIGQNGQAIGNGSLDAIIQIEFVESDGEGNEKNPLPDQSTVKKKEEDENYKPFDPDDNEDDWGFLD